LGRIAIMPDFEWRVLEDDHDGVLHVIAPASPRCALAARIDCRLR